MAQLGWHGQLPEPEGLASRAEYRVVVLEGEPPLFPGLAETLALRGYPVQPVDLSRPEEADAMGSDCVPSTAWLRHQFAEARTSGADLILLNQGGLAGFGLSTAVLAHFREFEKIASDRDGTAAADQLPRHPRRGRAPAARA